MKFTLSGSLEDNWSDDGWPVPFKPAVVWCGPLLLLVIRPEEGGSCETFRSFDQRALLCGKTQNHVVVARLQFRYCCLTDGKLVKIPNSQITQPRQVTSVLAPLTLQLHTHKFLDQGPRKQNTNTTI